ncbi:MAG TPA: hypothetical protein VMB47_19180, partial [Candidatus Aquilonibacter sp.]|nr:hypothetical protein [Candidatus Aquilonibacter sp.]
LAVFFPGPLFEHQIGPAIRYYFGGHFQLSAFNTYRDLAKGGLGREVLRGADQLAATAPFYVSAAYSLSAWLGVRAGLYVPGGPNKELTHMTPQLPVRP